MHSISEASRRYMEIIEKEENESRLNSFLEPTLNHPGVQHPEPFAEISFPPQRYPGQSNSHLIPQEPNRFQANLNEFRQPGISRTNHDAFLPRETASLLNRYQEHPVQVQNVFRENFYTGRYDAHARVYQYPVDPATSQYTPYRPVVSSKSYQVLPTSDLNPPASNLHQYAPVLPINHTSSNYPVNRYPLQPSNQYRAGPSTARSTDYYRPSSVSLLSIPDYYSSRPSINDQTYTIKSSVQDEFLGRESTCTENDFSKLFGSKENNSVFDESTRLRSDYFSSSKNNKTDNFNFESMSFSSPPQKRLKLRDDESGHASDSMMEEPFKKPKDKSTKVKISTESLFGDATMDSVKIFSQSDVLDDDGPLCISGVVDLSTSDEESFDKSVQVKTKKPVEVDVSLSFNVDSSVNSTYFEKLFDKNKKEGQKQKKIEVIAKKSSASVPASSRRLRSKARKRIDQVSASEPILPGASVSASKVSETSEQVIPVAVSKSKIGISSEPIVKSKSAEPTNPTSSSEPITATSNKEKDLKIINEILITKDFSKINLDTVNTYYNTKERQCFYENKKKMKMMEEGPANIDGDEPDFEEVKKYFRQERNSREIHIELGCKKHCTKNPDDDFDSFDYGDIEESLDEIEASFTNSRCFLTSTPERPIANIKEEENEFHTEHPVDMNAILTSQELARKNLILSDLSHISASIPIRQLATVDESYEFALNSILNITQRNISEKDGRADATDRFEFIFSLLRDEELMDQSLIPDYADMEIATRRRAVVMGQIEGIIQTILKTLVNQKPIFLKICKVRDFKDCTMANEVLSKKETAISMKSISFTNSNTERTFTILVHLLCEIYKMLSKGISITKRELYYRDPPLMLNQATVNRAIEDICILLNVLPWEVGILSTSKGLIAGDLKIFMADEDIIDCSYCTRAVPQVPSEIMRVQSNADYILIVEKDTVFTRLVQDKIFEKVKTKIILITAKGFPDINTRVLLKRLEKDLSIPIYIIVDADPHGIEIMFTYKFGSLQMVHNADHLAVKSVEWLGVYPSDIEPIGMAHTDLTTADLKKVDELLERPYLNAKLLQELNWLKNRKFKAEIEGLYETTTDYFIRDFIPSKINGIGQPFIDALAKSGIPWYKDKEIVQKD